MGYLFEKPNFAEALFGRERRNFTVVTSSEFLWQSRYFAKCIPVLLFERSILAHFSRPSVS